MANPTRRLGVVLFQLGGPDTPQAIEPFLFNLFCDPDIIDFPFARHRPQAPGQADFDHPRQESAAPLCGHRRSLAHPALHRAAGRCAAATSSRPMASTLIVSWPCATGIRSRLRQSNNCARRIATKSCSCRFILSIPAPPPEAASTNGGACFMMTCRCSRIETFYRHPALSGRAGRED